MNRLILVTSVTLAFPLSISLAQHGNADFSLIWMEVNVGTSMPVDAPNGMLEPGEAARLIISVAFTPGGTELSAPGGGTAPVAGFRGSGFGISPVLPESGTWSLLGITPGFSGSLGIPLPEGSIAFCHVEQPVPTGGAVPNPRNPIDHLWEANWSPASYSSRLVTLQMRIVFDDYAKLFLNTGSDPGGNPQFATVEAIASFGFTQVQVVPCPGIAVALAGLACPLLRRRRDRSDDR